MKESYYSIGEVSKLANVSIKALRYYDKIDLFKPAYVDRIQATAIIQIPSSFIWI